MLSDNRRKATAEYQQRILDLESELETAQRLIADQQHILKANLGAFVDEALTDTADEPEAVTHARAPGVQVSYADLPPIKLPEMGPPVGDIASRVLLAAADKGVVEGARVRVRGPAALPCDANPDSTRRERASQDTSTRGVGSPLAISAALLLGGVLFAVVWSRMGAFTPPRNSIRVPGTPVAAPKFAADEPAQTNDAAAAWRLNTGPVIEPVTAGQARTGLARHVAGRKNMVALRYRAPRHTGPRVIAAAQIPVHRTVPHTARLVSFHRSLRGGHIHEPTELSGQDWFDRELKRHPEPGWDEHDDKWMDRF